MGLVSFEIEEGRVVGLVGREGWDLRATTIKVGNEIVGILAIVVGCDCAFLV